MVRAGELLLRELVQPEREPLREPAVVHEDDRRAVLRGRARGSRGRSTARSSGSTARRPSPSARRPRAAAPRARRSSRARACPRAGRRPRGRAPSARPRRRARSRAPCRRRSGRSPRAGAASPRARCAGTARSTSALEPLEGQREVRAALRPRDRVHLVEDHGLDPAQRLARLRGEQQEERLGSRDEDVGRRLQHPPALVGGRVAGAHADRELRLEPGERAPQVALDVVVERLERRDVEQPEPFARASRSSRSIPMRKAASVFPEPVGAWMRTCPPRAIAGQPSACAGVGSANARSNQARVAVEKTSSGSMPPG